MQRRTTSAHPLCALLALAGCATHRPHPIEPARVLESLEAVEWELILPDPDSTETPAVGPRVLSAFAVSTNPQLAALRAELGVRRALLVESGLLPDPELGWDAMDVLASQLVDGTSSSVDALSGIGLMFPLLRSGERGARVGMAEWQAEEARRRITAAEWALTRDIHLACEEVHVAELLFAQAEVVTGLAESTHDYFERAMNAGAATAIQAHLARGELHGIQLDAVRAEARLAEARQGLNALLGLPPQTALALATEADPSAAEALQTSPAQLTEHAIESRPDLAVLLARYQSSEQEVRLAVSKQYPQFSMGTGISFTLPVFTRFGRPAIATALAKREQLRGEFTAAVHAARQEIAALHTLWRFAEREVELVETALLPNAEENLELSREALRQGEVTLLETLALQRALVEARTRHTETRAQRSKRAWALLAASGWLLGEGNSTGTNDVEESR
jgi:cobalt-zinc-cadmium efflux system outer membrane protein